MSQKMRATKVFLDSHYCAAYHIALVGGVPPALVDWSSTILDTCCLGGEFSEYNVFSAYTK